MVLILSPKNIPWKVVTALLVTIVASVALLNWAKHKRLSGTPDTRTQYQSPPTPPTATTAQPAASAPLGWKKIAGNRVELWLPPGYEGGNPSQDLEGLDKLKALNPDYEKVIQAIKLNSALALAAFDLQHAQSRFLTNVNVVPEQVSPGTGVEQYLQATAQEISPQYKVIEQAVVLLDRYRVVRLVTQATAGDTKVKQLFYAIPKGNTFWLVTYSTSAEEFEQRLPTFEQSVRTFTIKSPNSSSDANRQVS